MIVRNGSETEGGTEALSDLLEKTLEKIGRVYYCCVALAVLVFLILLAKLLW